jgi:hypothetical protein
MVSSIAEFPPTSMETWARAHYEHDLDLTKEPVMEARQPREVPPLLLLDDAPVVIRAGRNLDHAKFLFSAKELCRTIQHAVIVEFICGTVPEYSISHCFDYSPALGGSAVVGAITVTPLP